MRNSQSFASCRVILSGCHLGWETIWCFSFFIDLNIHYTLCRWIIFFGICLTAFQAGNDKVSDIFFMNEMMDNVTGDRKNFPFV